MLIAQDRIQSLNKAYERIISLVPSQTELLHYLGLRDRVVGITKFCIHPEGWFRAKTRIGGTKNIDMQQIRLLKPDLIIANKEENTREDVEELAAEFDVWVSDITTLEDAQAMITTVGNLTGTQGEAHHLVSEITSRFCRLKNELPVHTLSAAYLIWQPYMAAASGTFIDDMMRRAGFKNAFAHLTRYPEVTIEQLATCDVVMLSSEPFPFKEKHVQESQRLLPDTLIVLVDGEMFSWYGSRLLEAAPYFSKLLSSLRRKMNKSYDDAGL